MKEYNNGFIAENFLKMLRICLDRVSSLHCFRGKIGGGNVTQMREHFNRSEVGRLERVMFELLSSVWSVYISAKFSTICGQSHFGGIPVLVIFQWSHFV
jgi:hypothetical protein